MSYYIISYKLNFNCKIKIYCRKFHNFSVYTIIATPSSLRGCYPFKSDTI